MKQLLVVFACLVLAAGCKKKEEKVADKAGDKKPEEPKTPEPPKAETPKTEPPKPDVAAAAPADCSYKGKGGFCLAQPAGTTPTESGDNVIFKRSAEPKAAQDLVVRTEKFSMTPELLKGRRDFARKSTGAANITVLEDVDIADGKGFYVATESPTNVMVTAIVPNGDKMYRCSFNAHAKDKDALKDSIQACKSLKIAN